jgi:hypothetical protein
MAGQTVKRPPHGPASTGLSCTETRSQVIGRKESFPQLRSVSSQEHIIEQRHAKESGAKLVLRTRGTEAAELCECRYLGEDGTRRKWRAAEVAIALAPIRCLPNGQRRRCGV